MTDTVISSATKEVVIGFGRPFVMIGEKINPTGRKMFGDELKNGDMSRVTIDALAQVAAGAQMLDVNCGVPLADVLNWARPQHLPVLVIPGAGHFFHGELPVLKRAVSDFLRGRDKSVQ